MTDQKNQLLAAISFQNGGGDAVDEVLRTIVDRLRDGGTSIVGAIKHNASKPGRTRCDMSLEDLSTGELTHISQDLGVEATGCTLDTGALESAVGLTQAGLERGGNFLILNRFGKREEVGHGFRSAIEYAAGHQVPCIVGLGQDHVQGWQDFTGSLSVELPCSIEPVWEWCRDAQSRAASEA